MLGSQSQLTFLLPKDPDTVLYTTDYDIVRDNLDATARLGGIGAPPTIQLREPLVLPERSTSGEFGEVAVKVSAQLASAVSETAPAASSISRTPSVGSSAYKKVIERRG